MLYIQLPVSLADTLKELSIDISVSAILSASSIASLVKDAYTKIVAAAAASGKK